MTAAGGRRLAVTLVLAPPILLLVALIGPQRVAASEPARRLSVWSAYAGQEAAGLRAAITAFEVRQPTIAVDLLLVPFGAYLSKLQSAIPTGNGPDLFIDAHERLPIFEADRLIAAWGPLAEAARMFSGDQLSPLAHGDQLMALPLALKSAALFVNDALVAGASVNTTGALRALRGRLPRDSYPLAMEAENPYYAAALLHAFGGRLITEASDGGRYAFVGRVAEETVEVLNAWTRDRTIPEAANGDLVKRLFVSGQAATVISGPWLAADLPPAMLYHVQSLPAVDEARGAAMVPFVTIEGVFINRHLSASDQAAARALATFLAAGEGARLRAVIGGQVVADPAVRAGASVTAAQRAFAHAAENGRPMPVGDNMRAVWEPASHALQSALRRGIPPRVALASAAQDFSRNTRPPPPAASAARGALIVGLLCLWGAILLGKRVRDPLVRRRIRGSWPAYGYLAHGALAVLVLVISPLLVGLAISFFSNADGKLTYVGLGNYLDILTGSGGALECPGSFWFVLAVTVLWTAANISLHVLLGVTLALLLNQVQQRQSRLSRAYRVVLILPWAVPSYVTALTWKAMFHRQFGAINALLETLGLPAIDWFSRWTTAFSANLLTNVWLGFPFMMVVSLGALVAVPGELYQAAAVDGATRFQQLRLITLPMLRPSLGPAIAMGAAWTFNMFNVVFLVSGGEPGGTTEILISEAYRWAFTRSAQYGYAAAYAVLIFGALWLASRGRISAVSSEALV